MAKSKSTAQEPSDDETATMQAASGAPGTEEAANNLESAEPSNTVPEAPAAEEGKRWVRDNIGWVMAEMDHYREGKSADERERLNP